MLNLSRFDFQSDKIISSLSMTEQELIRAKGKILVFKKGKLIFYDGGVPTGAFMLYKGRAKIYKTGPYGKEQIFYIYNKGDLFGYHALLCNENYEDSCETLEDCETLFISQSDFKSLLADIPSLRTLIIQNMGHEFGVMVNTITILAQKPLRGRLALYLLILHERYQEEGQSAINLPREDLANIIGTTRESLGRLLKEFKKEGLIKIDKRKIELANYEQIHKLASS